MLRFITTNSFEVLQENSKKEYNSTKNDLINKKTQKKTSMIKATKILIIWQEILTFNQM